MTMPIRVQLSRRKGWKMPPNTVKVARPSRWGNLSACTRPHWCRRAPCSCCPQGDYCCVDVFEEYVASGIEGRPSRRGTLNVALDAEAGYPYRSRLVGSLAELRGKNLACFCPLDQPCHADVLLRIANETSSK